MHGVERGEQTSGGFSVDVSSNMQDLFIGDCKKDLCQEGFSDAHLQEESRYIKTSRLQRATWYVGLI